jgi:hypothetical protein
MDSFLLVPLQQHSVHHAADLTLANHVGAGEPGDRVIFVEIAHRDKLLAKAAAVKDRVDIESARNFHWRTCPGGNCPMISDRAGGQMNSQAGGDATDAA